MVAGLTAAAPSRQQAQGWSSVVETRVGGQVISRMVSAPVWSTSDEAWGAAVRAAGLAGTPAFPDMTRPW